MQSRMMKNKKAMSTIIVVLIFIVLAIAAVSIINYSIKKITEKEFGDKVSCFDAYAISQSFFIKSACYFNDNEISVNIERKDDSLNVTALKLAFIGEETTKWMIQEKKCSDVRTFNTSYGGYCSVLMANTEKNYVFNVSDLDTKNNIKLVIQQDNGKSCLVDEKEISERC